MGPQLYEQSVSAAQAILRLERPDLLIDGRWGTFTQTAYANASMQTRMKVDTVVRALTNGTTEGLTSFRKSQESAIATGAAQGKQNWAAIFVAEVVPAVKRAAQKAGFKDPTLVVSQLSLESGRGGHVSAPFNWAGIKATGGSPSGNVVRTKEVINGVSTTVSARFRAFDGVDDFVQSYIALLLRKWPGVVAATTPQEYTDALKVGRQGGYATEKPHIYASGLAGQQRKFA